MTGKQSTPTATLNAADFTSHSVSPGAAGPTEVKQLEVNQNCVDPNWPCWATPGSSSSPALKVTIAAGGEVKFADHDATTKAAVVWTGLCARMHRCAYKRNDRLGRQMHLSKPRHVQLRKLDPLQRWGKRELHQIRNRRGRRRHRYNPHHADHNHPDDHDADHPHDAEPNPATARRWKEDQRH